MTFASNGFANNGFQTDATSSYPAPGGSSGKGRGKSKRKVYEIQGKRYVLSERELDFLLYQLAQRLEDEPRKLVKPASPKQEPISVRVPEQWVAPTYPVPVSILHLLAQEAVRLDYPEVIESLRRMKPDDEDDIEFLLLYL